MFQITLRAWIGSLALTASAAAQHTLFVDANLATGANDGSSWTNAFQGTDGLRTAIDMAVSGDQVFVAEGVYRPTSLGPATGRDQSFQPASGVDVFGGFLGGESSPSERPPFGSAPTILTGDLDGNDAQGIFSDNSLHVVFIAAGSLDIQLDGICIVGGNANRDGTSDDDRGGGILARGVAQLALRNCSFQNNRASLSGGAGFISGGIQFIYCSFEDNFVTGINGGFVQGGAVDVGTGGISFQDCNFRRNRAGMSSVLSSGGAIYNGSGSSPMMLNCRFEDNRAERGGAITSQSILGADIIGCTFERNRAMLGGAVDCSFSQNSIRIVNSTFLNNLANNGGGVHIQFFAFGEIVNCTFVGNAIEPGSTFSGAGLRNSGSDVCVTNCIFWGNVDGNGNPDQLNDFSLTVASFNLIEGGFPGFGGPNFSADPEFADSANGDLSLLLSSPAIDAGNNSEVPANVLLDIAGNDRFVDIASVPDSGMGPGPVVDLGAFEFQGSIGEIDPSCVPTANSTGGVSRFTASGSVSLMANDLNCNVNVLPSGQFGFFIMAPGTGNMPLGGGVLCLSAPFVRFNTNVLNSGNSGSVAFSPDFLNLPQGTVFQAGDTWWLQFWHRDSGNTSNLSNSLGFTWQP